MSLCYYAKISTLMLLCACMRACVRACVRELERVLPVSRPSRVVLTDDCARCDYSQGQMWLPYKSNCHQFIVCEPNGKGDYTKHLMTCGSLFWNQAMHTCTDVMTGFCSPGLDVPYTGPPTVMGNSSKMFTD